jgi:hypothetical protein
MIQFCEASFPKFGGDGLLGGWSQCPNVAVNFYSYSCEHGHFSRKATCLADQPEPGGVGCMRCLQDGHECEMTFELASSDTPAPSGTGPADLEPATVRDI